MAGVYIPGMEMPKSCTECLNIGWQYVFECNLDDVESGARLGSCPLIPVPDHGGLIDKEAFYKDICDDIKSANDVGIPIGLGWMWAKLNDALKNAEVLAPADKEGGIEQL